MSKADFEPDFEKLLVESVNEALSSLGESPKQAIFFYLEKSFSIKQQEISRNIEAFDSALRTVFGVGADFLETLIIRRLNEKADLTFQELILKSDDFIGKVESVRQKLKR
jgi:hypothetical protein